MIKNKQEKVESINKVVEMLNSTASNVPSTLEKEYDTLVETLDSHKSLIPNLTDFEIGVLYEKAGRLAYLFGLINFSGNNDSGLFSDETDENIKYSVALLANYQTSIDDIMDSDIQGLVYTGTNQQTGRNEYKIDAENSFSVSGLNEVDREFIDLEYYNQTPTKQDVIDRLKGINTTKPIPQKIENAIAVANNNKKDKMGKKWETLKYEEIETRKFLKSRDAINSASKESEKDKIFREAYMSFRETVVRRYLGGVIRGILSSKENEKNINGFLLKFSRVWRIQKYAKKIESMKGFRLLVDRFVRNPGGSHEHLRTSMHIDYSSNKKWGMDGPILTLLLKRIIQKTETVEVEIPYAKNGSKLKVTHLDVYGGKETDNKKKHEEDVKELNAIEKLIAKNPNLKNDSSISNKSKKLKAKVKAWHTGCSKLAALHTQLKENIDESNTMGEIVQKLIATIEDDSMMISEDCKKDFYIVLNKAFRNEVA